MDNSSKPDLKAGFLFDQLPDGGMVLGQVDGEDVVLARRSDELFAVGASCTHYHGPLAEGLMVGETVRCPWHHACFSLRSGEALRAPALDPIACWRVERIGGKAYVREKLSAARKERAPSSAASGNVPTAVVIVGGGAAGLAAAEMLRREGYEGSLTMISADEAAPCDRPNLSKDFLAGTAPEDWIPLRSPDYYKDRRIELLLKSRVTTLNLAKKQVELESGKAYGFDALLLATGAEPVKLQIEGAAAGQLNYLRTLADSRAIIAKASSAKRVAVVGASFIGLEVAASLRTRGVAVEVIAPEAQPLERVMGLEVGQFVRQLHEEHGVVFHMGATVKQIDGRTLTLSKGPAVEADFIVLGVGVRPSLTLAEEAGLATERGVVVNQYLETSAPGVFAAGDIARWPDPHSGQRIRVEHWVVAERQGQAAARNILGYREPFNTVPFFWSQHYDVAINYVGHAEKWDAIEVDGSLEARDCAVTYKLSDKTLAVATISRDLESLKAEEEMESATRS
jgi:NADPH-dependent 2,4-dienoyl-CoA reductase/sulfur reductase-like enzyme/nitrite reductase/ring-hydroxylating ferredoxin subunit